MGNLLHVKVNFQFKRLTRKMFQRLNFLLCLCRYSFCIYMSRYKDVKRYISQRTYNNNKQPRSYINIIIIFFFLFPPLYPVSCEEIVRITFPIKRVDVINDNGFRKYKSKHLLTLSTQS